MDFLTGLSSAASIANSLSGLFGGDGKSERESMKDQLFFNLASAKMLPYAQTVGLRRAGLNPMLAVSKGIPSAPAITSSPGAEDNAETSRRQASTAASIAAAQIANLHASTSKLEAETANTNVNSARQAAEIEVLRQEPPLRNAQQNYYQAHSGLAGQQNIESYERSQLLAQQVIQSKADTAKSQAQKDESIARTHYTNVEIQQAREILKGQLLEGKIDETAFGDAMRHLKRLSQSITGLGGAARELRR